MYYRRKIILALLEVFNKSLKNTELQKYLFLFTNMQKKPSYSFVPYKYGCFSFQATADKQIMINSGLLKNDNNWAKLDKQSYFEQLKKEDQQNLFSLKNNYSKLTLKQLIRSIYINNPFYTINSTIVQNVMSDSEYQELYKKIKLLTKDDDKEEVFTIGYEGKQVEDYINQLVKANVKAIIDVRKNPISMKFGFSKTKLKAFLEKLNIKYYHFPTLGIDSALRKKFLTPEKKDYKSLFKEYESSILPFCGKEFKQVRVLFDEHKKIAFTCFESNHLDCHRSIVANEVVNKMRMLKVIHL